MKSVHIKFTRSQLKILEPLFFAIYDGGGQDALLGQVFSDGITVRIIENKKCLAIQKVVNGKSTVGYLRSSKVTTPQKD